jgi:penicillin amidase
LVLASACGDNGDGALPFESPYDKVPEKERLDLPGLKGPVDLVRDEYGIPHIYATTVTDLAFVNGYIMAHDRLPQMNLFRHASQGRVAELFGALEPDKIDDDIKIRLHRLKPLATEAWQMLEASNDPTDKEIVAYFSAYADGVNAYAKDLQNGKYRLDSAVEVFFPPDKWETWTAIDSLTIGRLQTFALSYDEYDVRISRSFAMASKIFPSNAADPDDARRENLAHDLIQVRPNRPVSPLAGFPNVADDTGSRAKPGPGLPATTRPWVDLAVLDDALVSAKPESLAGLNLEGPLMASNNWVVGPKLAGAGKAIVSNDTHLPLINPSIWWMVHLTVPGELDIEGISFPGLPAIQLGHNEHLAWGATVVVHDVYDFYAEKTSDCPAGKNRCAEWKGQQVPIETWSEEIQIGANSTITGTKTVTFERVPHHGPIVPTIKNHTIVPREGNQALSVKFTGHEVTWETRAVFRMVRAKTVAEGIAALDDWNHGGMNWILADDTGTIGYTGSARVPRRSAGCFTYDRKSKKDGVAPFLVQPGDGSCEWTGFVSDRYLPHAVNPAKGYLATANADPVGETFDDNALNGPLVDQDGAGPDEMSPLYLGSLYDPGFRVGRIYDRLDAYAAAGKPVGMEELASIQADNHSNLGERMRPFIAAAVEAAQKGTQADAKAFLDGLPAARRERLLDAVARLKDWSLETPAAVGVASDAEIADSAATVIFNAFAVYWYQNSYGDELRRIGERVELNVLGRLGLSLLEHPDELLTGIDPSTGEAVLCDDLATDGVIESCTLILLKSLDQGLSWAETEFATADMTMWRWGDLHRVTLESQLPSSVLEVPPPDEADSIRRGGYPRHGDTYAVDASNTDYDDFDFTYEDGPAMRHITVLESGKRPVTYFAIPGGQIFDRTSPHYRDIADEYYMSNQYFVFPWTAETVVEKAEERWRFIPAK